MLQGFFDTTVLAKVVEVFLGEIVVKVFVPHTSAKFDSGEDSTVKYGF